MNSSSILSAVLAVMMSFTVAVSTAFATKPSQLIIALGEEPTTGFDPIYGWGRYGDPLIQSTLLRRNAELNFYGDLAQDWQLSQDRLIWSVDLKPGIKFSDGNLLTAADVAFSYLTAKKAATTHDLRDRKSVV